MKSDRFYWMLSWAAAQALSLLLLHNWIQSLAKAGKYFYLIWPLYVIAVLLPPTLQLLAQYRHDKKLWLYTSVTVSVLAACGSYLGAYSWVESLPDYDFAGQVFIFGLITAVCWLILLPFIEHRLHFGRWFSEYGFLFWIACSYNVRLSSAGIFTSVFWALLGLWAALFKVLKIDFFTDLFSHRSFVYPAIALAIGFGLTLYESRQELLLSHYRNLLNLVAWLLPMVAGIMLLFLAVLPFKGLEPLWQTGHATTLMLGLLALMIVLFNACWQDSASPPKFGAGLLRVINAGFLAMPVYVGLSAYAMSLRISQYGWSSDRVWAVLLIIVAGFYATGYAAVAFRNRACWMSEARFVNIAAALSLVGLLLLTGTPILNPARIAVSNQLARLMAGKTKLADFDFQYLRFEGGKYGDEALKSLAQLTDHPEADAIRNKAETVLQSTSRSYASPSIANLSKDELIKRLIVFPKDTPIDDAFYDHLLEQEKIKKSVYRSYKFCIQNKQNCYLLAVDLNGDQQNELVIMDESISQSGLFVFRNQSWQYVGILRFEPPYHGVTDLKEALAASDIDAIEHAWRSLRIGKNRFTVEIQE